MRRLTYEDIIANVQARGYDLSPDNEQLVKDQLRLGVRTKAINIKLMSGKVRKYKSCVGYKYTPKPPPDAEQIAETHENRRNGQLNSSRRHTNTAKEISGLKAAMELLNDPPTFSWQSLLDGLNIDAAVSTVGDDKEMRHMPIQVKTKSPKNGLSFNFEIASTDDRYCSVMPIILVGLQITLTDDEILEKKRIDRDYIHPCEVKCIILFRNCQEIPTTNKAGVGVNLAKLGDVRALGDAIYIPDMPGHESKLLSIQNKFRELHQEFGRFSLAQLTYVSDGASEFNPKISPTTAKEKQCFRYIFRFFPEHQRCAPFEQGQTCDCILVVNNRRIYVSVKSARLNYSNAYCTKKGAAVNWHHIDVVIICFFGRDREFDSAPTRLGVLSAQEYYGSNPNIAHVYISETTNDHILADSIDCDQDDASIGTALKHALLCYAPDNNVS